MPCDNFLDLFLAQGSAAFGLPVANTRVFSDNRIDNNLVLILWVQIGVYLLRTSSIYTLIPCVFRIFMWNFKAEFVLNRSITYDFKKVVKR
jgi:hypothetical protein